MEGVQNDGKTSSYLRCRDMGSEVNTLVDRIRNEIIIGIAKVGEITNKMQESSLKLYGHVLRR